MAQAVYLLCALASSACALLLLRAYRQSRVRLLFWSTLCFAALAVNNVVLFIDLVIVTDADLTPIRSLVAISGMGALLVSFIWDAT
jgi:hypothetical protein